MLIGILQTGDAPDTLKPKFGDYPDFFMQLLAGYGLTFRTYHVANMNFPSDVHECEGWLITGSRHGAYEDHPFIPPLMDFIRAVYDKEVPIVGICFGHQIIAQALGGRVERFKGGWAVGVTHYDFKGERIALNAWHRDQVVEKPAMAQTVACNEFCENAALIYPNRAFTIQAHPEFSNEFVEGLLDTRAKGLVPDDVQEKARAQLANVTDSAKMAQKIAEFFKSPEHSPF